MSWENAGGLVWHATDVDPSVLGQAMRAAGFGWVAVLLADGTTPSGVWPQWISRFRAASGLPVGGWSVLRTDPAAEADLASRLIRQDGLAFFIADAEQEYGYTNGSQHSPERFDRSRQFVTAFRATQPNLPAALSSYCQPAMHDLDWAAWANAGFEFLPQAFVGSLGAAGTPATCVKGAAKYFPPAAVHPTIGLFAGPYGSPSPSQYGHLLAQAGTTGFSLYPAENAGPELQAYAQQIQTEHIAHTTA
jgi:hypothetical protein